MAVFRTTGQDLDEAMATKFLAGLRKETTRQQAKLFLVVVKTGAGNSKFDTAVKLVKQIEGNDDPQHGVAESGNYLSVADQEEQERSAQAERIAEIVARTVIAGMDAMTSRLAATSISYDRQDNHP